MEELSSSNILPHNISSVIEKIKAIGGDKVRFIIIYGSAVKGKLTDKSDIDLAVFYNADMQKRFEYRVSVLGRVDNIYDIQIFQDLPIYIQKDIISNGKVIYFKNYNEIFDVFMQIIKKFEDFKPYLELYYSKLGV